jgi:hypothetical protein
LVDLENAKTQNLALLRRLNAAQAEVARRAERDPGSVEVREVLDYWLATMSKNANTLTPMDGVRAKAVRARLRQGFTVERLKKAIDHCARSEWHMGFNPQGRRYDDIADICANEASVEKFEAMTETPAQRRQRVAGSMLKAASEHIHELREVVDLQRRWMAMQDQCVNRLLDEVNEARRRALRVVA